MNPLAKKIRELQAEFNNALSYPPIPSRDDKIILKSLEELRLNNFEIDDRKTPDICGAAPRRIVVEARKSQNKTALTYWYYWDHDLQVGDHPDWEPVSLVYVKGELSEIYSRVHNGLVRYRPAAGRPFVYFIRYGHTPAVRVSDKETDVELFKLNDRRDVIREKWLDLCYRYAESNRWTKVKQPKLELSDGPVLDPEWKAWGKHAVYLRI